MKPEFKQLIQIGIVVRDVQEAVRCYEDEFGMGPWLLDEMHRGLPHFSDLEIDGKPGDLEIKTAFLKAYGMEIELIEPVSDSAYKTWLNEHGPGVHHLWVGTEDDYDAFLEKTEKLTGKKPWIRGKAKNIGMDFAYVDLREKMGLIVEVARTVRDGCTTIDY